MQFFPLLKTIHGWTGALLLPWVLIIGFTGFYLNHGKMFDGVFNKDANEPVAVAPTLDAAGAGGIALTFLAQGETLPEAEEIDYHNRPAFLFKLGKGHEVTVEQDNALVHNRTRYIRTVYDRSGHEVGSKFYWGNIFKSLHTDGWLNGTFGTILSDAVSLAMILFGASGIYLFLAPRMRRWSARRGRGTTQTEI